MMDSSCMTPGTPKSAVMSMISLLINTMSGALRAYPKNFNATCLLSEILLAKNTLPKPPDSKQASKQTINQTKFEDDNK